MHARRRRKILGFPQSETRFYDENQRFRTCSETKNLKIFRPAAGYKGGTLYMTSDL